jgi:hypothetical protein
LSYPPRINEYYDFSMSFVLKLITYVSLPLKMLGLEALEEIIDASIEKRPPPKAYVVEGAGLDFVNGRYDFDPQNLTEEGWVKDRNKVSYVRKIPRSTVGGSAGKTLTLFQCTMRSQQRWWFISEADKDEPGTDRDIDYYQHKSKQSEEALPSAHGWDTCRQGVDPPPLLRAVGLAVPPGEEENTLECVLVKWATDNGVIGLMTSMDSAEIVGKSASLAKFLADVREKQRSTAPTIRNAAAASKGVQGVSYSGDKRSASSAFYSTGIGEIKAIQDRLKAAKKFERMAKEEVAAAEAALRAAQEKWEVVDVDDEASASGSKKKRTVSPVDEPPA